MYLPPPLPSVPAEGRRTQAEAAVQRDVNALVTRLFFSVAAACATAGMIIVLMLNLKVDARTLWGMLAIPLGFATALVVGFALAKRGRLPAGVMTLLLGTYLGVTAFAVITSMGLHSIIFGFFGIIVIVAGLLVSGRASILLGLLCAMTLVALYLAETLGWIEGFSALHRLPLYNRLLAHLVMVMSAAALGLLASRLLLVALRAAKTQEHRFGGLLAIGSDFHWIKDAQFRFARLEAIPGHASWLSVESHLGCRLWEVADTTPIDSGWDEHRAVLEARKPFRDFVVRVGGADGQTRYVSISGEPVFDEGGEFHGYWGIGRQVTAAVTAQLQVKASEQRHRELFLRSPSPLIIHRKGLIVAANAAAGRLFGFDDIAAMTGRPVLDLNDESSRARYAKRIASLEDLPPGSAIPTAELLMRKTWGDKLLVQTSAVRVEFAEGPATLSMYLDITEQRRAEVELARAREQAEAANRAKSMFLANMTHEIRTPLSGVLGLSRLARDSNHDPERVRTYLAQLVESTESLARIINDVLDLSKVEAGKLTLERTDFDLHDLLGSIRNAYAELASKKGLGFELRIGADVPVRVTGDPTRTRQILVNYVSNALKFTVEGRIAVFASSGKRGWVRLEVHDTGIGIDAATQARLFTAFMQADESTSRKFGGSGLGLSICRHLARLMGGDTGLSSTPGVGSAFWVELPLPTAKSQAAESSNVDTAAADLQVLRGARVLLAEDNPVNLLIAETFLSDWGVEVVTALDGRQAVDVVRRDGGRFDAVLMDMHMPVMSGHDATAEIRRMHSKDELPIIALTAAALVSERKTCEALGMNGFVSKPFIPERLRHELAHCLRPRIEPPPPLPAASHALASESPR